MDRVRWGFVEAVPPQERVVATFDYLAPLSLRKHLYSFHKIYEESYQNLEGIRSNELNTGNSFVLPDQVHYALIDFKDPWLKQSLKFYLQKTSQRVQEFLKKVNWKVIKSDGSIVLLKR